MSEGVHRHTSTHAPEESASWKKSLPIDTEAAHHEERLQSVELELEALRRYLGPAIREAIKDGITDVLKDDTVMDRVLDNLLGALQRRSTKVAGTFTLGLFSELPMKVAKFAIIGMLVYSLGGWTLVASFFKSLFASGNPP